MSSARITIEVNGVKYPLYFGMVATEIISNKTATASLDGAIDNFRSLAFTIYGGLCNEADIKEVSRPSFEEAYHLAEEISMLQDSEVASQIVSAWTESRPYDEMMKRLASINSKKKAEADQENP